MQGRRRIVVIGGGAAGFFGAIACAEAAGSAAEVVIHEATAHPLAKVRVSGGGRCNVTHACFAPRELVTRYPRGARELLGPFTRFGPRETIAWFAARGVELKTEADGRMFPVTDDSATIVACLERAAAEAGVRVELRSGVRTARRPAAAEWELELVSGATLAADGLLVATGGNRGSTGLAVAQAAGHTIQPPVPSLFTFHLDDARLRGLAGLAAPHVAASVPGTRLRAEGPLLVTHWGVSGPAILRLSAWGARELAECEYRFPLRVDWAPALKPEAVRAALRDERTAHPKRQVATAAPAGLAMPVRLWERLVAAAEIAEGATWAGTANTSLDRLAAQVSAGEFAVAGKSLNKEEFVTCGGVTLREVDFSTMESRCAPGLHFAGEVLDIDGITGGFNFQAAWTTGWHAGRALAGVVNH